jgi:hypothetical protein
MSTSKFDTSGVFQALPSPAASAQPTRLRLNSNAVRICKNGIEFLSSSPIPAWKEMSVELQTPRDGKVQCRGIVVSCIGNRHSGYVVSMVFMNLSRQSQERLSSLAYSQPLSA